MMVVVSSSSPLGDKGCEFISISDFGSATEAKRADLRRKMSSDEMRRNARNQNHILLEDAIARN